MTADNAYPNLDATVHSQPRNLLYELNPHSQGHLSAVIHIYLLLSHLFTSLSLNPIIVLAILHGKLCRALLV
jgi:hypothetical protein